MKRLHRTCAPRERGRYLTQAVVLGLVLGLSLSTGCGDDGTVETSEQPNEWELAVRDGRDVQLYYLTNGRWDTRVEAEERDDEVALTLIEQLPETVTLVGIAKCVTVRLPDSLRGRRLVSGLKRPEGYTSQRSFLARYARKKPRCKRVEFLRLIRGAGGARAELTYPARRGCERPS